MIKVIFVCLGNICRSPMAEGLFKKKIEDLGLEKDILIESRATSSWEVGNPVHRGTKQILNQHHINTDHMYAKQISDLDFYDFDYIIGMDESNVRTLIKMNKKMGNKVHLFLDILNESHNKSIPDPYYSGNFIETYELITSAIDLWIEKFKNDLKN